MNDRIADNASPSRGFSGRPRVPRSAAGFTLVELLVVMGIIVMAAGLMAPAITNFFKNRALDGVRGSFGGVFSRARLKAVTEGRDISVIFFREGVRIFDESNQIFADGEWSANDSALGGRSDELWYVLGCTERKVNSVEFQHRDPGVKLTVPFIPDFEHWLLQQEERRAKLRSNNIAVNDSQFDITGLAKVTFRRDGTLIFGPRMSDVRSADYNLDPPRMADIQVYQLNNRSACFIDLRPTGRSRSKISTLPKPEIPPFAGRQEQGE